MEKGKEEPMSSQGIEKGADALRDDNCVFTVFWNMKKSLKNQSAMCLLLPAAVNIL